MSSPPRDRRVVAAEIAHDANNMLMVVLACADHLQQHGRVGTETLHVLADLQAAAERASALVRQLVVTDEGMLRVESVEVDDLLAGIDGMLRVLTGPTIDLNVAREAHGSSVRGLRGRLENVVVNLVCNARDAMPRDGRIEIGTANVERGGVPHVALTVRDSGVGMDEATKLRVFEPFFTTKPPGRGAGLGLSVARMTIAEFGGAIEVDTAEGHGTTVRVYLPRDQGTARNVQPVVNGVTSKSQRPRTRK